MRAVYLLTITRETFVATGESKRLLPRDNVTLSMYVTDFKFHSEVFGHFWIHKMPGKSKIS